MKAQGDELIFSTGKTVYAHRCIIGLSMSGSRDDDLLHYGYDGTLNLPNADDWAEPSSILTPAECVELADEMLRRWAEFRAKYAQGDQGQHEAKD